MEILLAVDPGLEIIFDEVPFQKKLFHRVGQLQVLRFNYIITLFFLSENFSVEMIYINDTVLYHAPPQVSYAILVMKLGLSKCLTSEFYQYMYLYTGR